MTLVLHKELWCFPGTISTTQGALLPHLIGPSGLSSGETRRFFEDYRWQHVGCPVLASCCCCSNESVRACVCPRACLCVCVRMVCCCCKLFKKKWRHVCRICCCLCPNKSLRWITANAALMLFKLFKLGFVC